MIKLIAGSLGAITGASIVAIPGCILIAAGIPLGVPLVLKALAIGATAGVGAGVVATGPLP
jgi:hypothetical protein